MFSIYYILKQLKDETKISGSLAATAEFGITYVRLIYLFFTV